VSEVSYAAGNCPRGVISDMFLSLFDAQVLEKVHHMSIYNPACNVRSTLTCRHTRIGNVNASHMVGHALTTA
jgi:hypothetical protein